MMGSSLDLPLNILRVDIVIYRLILFERGEQEGINSPVALGLISKHFSTFRILFFPTLISYSTMHKNAIEKS